LRAYHNLQKKCKGEIWGAQNVSETVDGVTHAVLRYVRINASTGQVISQGLIGSGDTAHDYYFGAIVPNALGSVVISYTRSGPSEFASTYASVGSYDASTVIFGATPILLHAGTHEYDLTSLFKENRWGDYSAITLDPLDQTKFWSIQEFASDPRTVFNRNTMQNETFDTWSTRVTELLVPAPEPSSLAAMGIGVFVLAGCIARKRRA